MDRACYYEAALRGLLFVENRRETGRRFGANADARWNSFRGDLSTADRMDLLIRDADAQWPGAFGARSVFEFQAVATDEAFGSQWDSMQPVNAEEMWRRVTKEAAATSAGKLLGMMAKAWDLELTPVEVGCIAPTDTLIVAGPSAIAATLVCFAQEQERLGLDWHQQVHIIATPPSHRQLAAMGSAIVNTEKSTQLYSANMCAPLKDLCASRLLTSSDAAPEDLKQAQQAASQGAGA